MTDTDTSTELLAALATVLGNAEDEREIYEGVCEMVIDAGFAYATVDPPSGEGVERGEPEEPVETFEIATEESWYETLTIAPATGDDLDLQPVVELTAVGIERFEVADSRRNLIKGQARKVRKLHSIAARMAECTTDVEIFQLAMDAAENILEFDISSLDVVEDGVIVPRILSTGMPPDDSLRLAADEGIAGETYQEDRTIIVDDLQNHPKGDPENPEHRALLSVPIVDHGVFQAGARDVGAFDEADAELAELLMTHVSQSLERLAADAQIRESEEKYRTLVERSHDAVIIYQDNELVYGNTRATDLVGREMEALLGTAPGTIVDPTDADRVTSVVAELAETPDSHATYQARLVTPSGTRRHCECSASRISYRGADAVLLSIRDITDRKRRQEELERQNERLEEFASVVSHDLRNPLNVVRGSVELAAQTGETQHFERAEEALERMEALIEGILDLARQGRLVAETERVALDTVAERAWRSVAAPDAILDLATDGAMLEADPLRLQELLENLFRNAVEHGGADVAVTVDGLADGRGFVVSDDGPGIPTDCRERVFERGYSSTTTGTGFGLAIVDAIADAHGWSVAAVEADGACFEVRDAPLI